LEFPHALWGDYARNFIWSKLWEHVYEFDGVHHKWFRGAKLNITVNALDRHAHSDRHNRVAYIWLGEDGSERQVTYGQLHALVCRFANGLKSLGLKKGDRVIIYMPLTLEGVVSMLACSRIGAVHSVVYAGLGHTALRDRIVDAQAKIVVTGDVGYRRGKIVQLKSITDEAVDGLEFIEKVVVFTREQTELRPNEISFAELLKFPDQCSAEEMEAEDSLFILYTSGSTGKPKGVVHVHGGYMVGIVYHLQNYYDVNEQDVFWCTSDIGWVVGHSFIVYGPLCAGVTTMFREGAIDFPSPDTAWEIVERYRVSKMFTAPTALRMFMRYGEAYPQKHDISSLRVIACAGEPLNPEAWKWAQTYIAGDGKWGYVIDNWWQTELGSPAIGTPPSMAMRPGKCGIALTGADVDIVDENGRAVPAGVGGRLVLRRPFPTMMRTVYGEPRTLRTRVAEDPGLLYHRRPGCTRCRWVHHHFGQGR
jgi:acetyl-CoA synthetase